MQFVPVPYAALGLVTPAEYGALLDIYQRAHRLRWQSYAVTTRSLATAWGMSSRRVWDLLGNMEAAGLLTVVRGTERTPSVLTVVDPTQSDAVVTTPSEPSVKRMSERMLKRMSERSNDGSTEVRTDSETHVGTQVETHVVTTLSEPELEPELEPEPEEHRLIRAPLLLTPAVATKPDDWTRLATRYAARPHCSMPRSRKAGTGLHLAKMITLVGVDDAMMLLEWWERGPERALYLREQKHGIDTIARKAEEYLVMAREWKATDRGPAVVETREQRKARERAEDDAASAEHRARLARQKAAANGR